MWQIESYHGMFQAIRALTADNVFKTIILRKKMQNKKFVVLSHKCSDLSCTPTMGTTIHITEYHS